MQVSRLFFVIALLAFLLVGPVGMGLGMAMSNDGMGMIDCPLMGHDAAVCSMNPLEHIGMWQTMFAAIPVQSLVLSLVLLLAAFALVRFKELLYLLALSLQPVHIFYDFEVISHDPLRRFMARGLVHPKIF